MHSHPKVFAMSFHTEKSDKSDKSDVISMEDWQNRLENFKFKQTDMNKLIMNYLVTGKCGAIGIRSSVRDMEWTQGWKKRRN